MNPRIATIGNHCLAVLAIVALGCAHLWAAGAAQELVWHLPAPQGQPAATLLALEASPR